MSPIKFYVTEGLRTKERQEQLQKEGKSWTSNSKHLTGDAIDIVCYLENFNEQTKYPYIDLAFVIGMFYAVSKEMEINIRTGMLWDGKTGHQGNLDIFHIELA
jgi:hypothetical protein